MNGTVLNAVHATSRPSFMNERGSGRCRLSISTISRIGARIGSIAHISLNISLSAQRYVLCTVWPDTTCTLSENCICIDDSVYSGDDNVDWTSCQCKVVKIYPPADCSSVCLNVSPELLNRVSVLGLPLQAGFKINFFSLGRSVQVMTLNGSANVCVGTVLTIKYAGTIAPKLVAGLSTLSSSSASSSTTTSSSSSSSSSVSSVSPTSTTTLDAAPTEVVMKIIKTFIQPSLLRPESPLLTRGALLLGPPGVGKTFAVRAVQALCSSICTVRIYELNIPDLLRDSDSVRKLSDILTNAAMPLRARGGSSEDGRMVKASVEKKLSEPLQYSPATRLNTAGSLGSTPNDSSRYKFTLSSSSPSPSTPTPKSTPKSAVTPSPLSNAAAAAAGETADRPRPQWMSPNKSKSQPRQTDATPPPPSSVPSTPSHTRSQTQPEVSFVIIDEIDSLGSGKRPSDIQLALKSRLCSWFDSVNDERAGHRQSSVPCFLIGTSNRSEDVDGALRRGGRFELELEVVGIRGDRQALLQSLLDSRLSGRVSGDVIRSLSSRWADRTGGYVAADVSALVKEAMKILTELQGTEEITEVQLNSAFERACLAVLPSCLRGVSVKIPMASFDDIVGYEEAKRSLNRIMSFADPDHRSRHARFGLTSPGGAILHGPPGNSKTRLVLAATSSHGLPIISLSAADVYSAYVGDAEAEIRKAFRVARQASPCVLFFDEIDSLVTDRGFGSDPGGSVESRVLSTLLNEMDGIGAAGDVDCGVIVLAATNRLDCIDAALLRKGRFHHVLHIPTPSLSEGRAILDHIAGKLGLSDDEVRQVAVKIGVSSNPTPPSSQITPSWSWSPPPLSTTSQSTPVFKFQPEKVVSKATSDIVPNGYSGADIENFCREVAMTRLRQHIAIQDKVCSTCLT